MNSRRAGWKGPDSIGFGLREWLTSMPQSQTPQLISLISET